MLKAAIWSFMGVCLYALANAILDRHGSKYNTFLLIAAYAGVISLIALATFAVSAVTHKGTFVTGPWSWRDVMFLFGVGVIFFFADRFYIGAYASTYQNKMAVITSMGIVMPVMTQLIGMLLAAIEKGTFVFPNRWVILGFLTGSISVLFTIKGAAEAKG